MRLFLLPYKPASKSAKALADRLGVKRCSLNRSTNNTRQRTVINWGHSGHDLSPYVLSNTARVYNPPTRVAVAVNKLHCLQAMYEAGVNVPPFTTSTDQARQWLAEGKEVVQRQLLRGSGGDGIRVLSSEDGLAPAPLYTMYVKKKQEYRVHVINGVVADVQRKVKRAGATIFDWKIRNVDSGFIFQRIGVNPPQDVLDQALLAMRSVDLDFGAVDVIFNAHEDKAYVLEINTACGLEGTTLDMYADGLKAMIDSKPIKEWRHWQEVVQIGTSEVHDLSEGPSPYVEDTEWGPATVTEYPEGGRIVPSGVFTSQYNRDPTASEIEAMTTARFAAYAEAFRTLRPANPYEQMVARGTAESEARQSDDE